MAAKTTAKVATQTGAAKDDLLLGGTEDNAIADLNVLANDPGAARLWSLNQGVPSLAGGTQVPSELGVFHSLLGARISANADGTVHYDASSLNLQSLAQGESMTDQFIYTVRMANGALSTAKVFVSVAGANDAPTLIAPAATSISDSANQEAEVTVGGALLGDDVDNGAVLTYVLVGGASDYGSMTVNADGTWSFTDVPGALDALGAGQSAQATFQAAVNDEHGASSATVDIVVNLIGVNDTADVAGDDSGSVFEDGAATAAGTLSVSDRDAGEDLFAALDDAALHGVYGDFSFDGETGNWTYLLRNADANVQALNSGDAVSDSLTVASLDGTDSVTVTVTVNGVDEPVVEPPAPRPEFKINHGKDVSDHNVFTGFTSTDRLLYVPSLTLDGATVELVYWDADLQLDTLITLHQGGGQQEAVEAVLIGYSDFSFAQLQVVS